MTDFRRSAQSTFLFLVFILIFVLWELGIEAPHLERAMADSQKYSPTWIRQQFLYQTIGSEDPRNMLYDSDTEVYLTLFYE